MNPYSGAADAANPGPCIDEDTLGRLVQGLLPREEVERVERHIDGCASCSQVLAEFARTYRSAPPVAATEPLPAPLARAARFSETPRAVGRYVVERKLAEGSMGVVYVAHDPMLGRRVALKLVRPDGELAADPEGYARLLREAHALARLSAPNVVQVHDAGRWEDGVFLAMELVDGLTLAQWLGEKPRTAGDIVQVFRRAGEGLAAAHEAGIVHRDFKPANVLIGRNGEVKVADFGLTTLEPEITAAAQAYRAPAPASPPAPIGAMTAAGTVVGTPAYMAPEQLFGRGASARSDQFAFAVALYEALYGTRPYLGSSIEELRWAIASGQIAKARTNARSSPDTAQALRRALAADPERRYASMRELLRELSSSRRSRADVHVLANIAAQIVLLCIHLILALVLARAVMAPGPAPVSTSSLSDTDRSSGAIDLLAMLIALAAVWTVIWAPLGLAWLPLNLFGLIRRKSWAPIASLLYAVACIPTCLATPYALYAFYSLTRSTVRDQFESE